MARVHVLFAMLFVLNGCSKDADGTRPPAERTGREPAPSEPVSADEAARARAEAAATQLSTMLRARLLAAMAEGGPARAVEVCANEAPSIARTVEETTGARVGRSSLRLRNPADAPPDWVATWLEAEGERSAVGVAGFSRIEHGRARVLRPIAVEGPCLTCHGPTETLAPEVHALIRARYPDDRATGYALGDLRGALWSEVEVR